MMHTLQLSLDTQIIHTLNLPDAVLEREIRQAAATQLYAQSRLTLGQAASLAGVSRADFMEMLSEKGVPVVQTTLDEVLEDSAVLSRIRQNG